MGILFKFKKILRRNATYLGFLNKISYLPIGKSKAYFTLSKPNMHTSPNNKQFLLKLIY
jgi:hypothetical protein